MQVPEPQWKASTGTSQWPMGMAWADHGRRRDERESGAPLGAPDLDFLGADDGIRTRDPHLGKVMRYQLRYVRMLSTFGVGRSPSVSCERDFIGPDAGQPNRGARTPTWRGTPAC